MLMFGGCVFMRMPYPSSSRSMINLRAGLADAAVEPAGPSSHPTAQKAPGPRPLGSTLGVGHRLQDVQDEEDEVASPRHGDDLPPSPLPCRATQRRG